jgi:hypothetical protein
MPRDDRLLTLPQVAAIYGVGVETVRKRALAGALPAYQLMPRVLRFDPAQLPKQLPSMPRPGRQP